MKIQKSTLHIHNTYRNMCVLKSIPKWNVCLIFDDKTKNETADKRLDKLWVMWLEATLVCSYIFTYQRLNDIILINWNNAPWYGSKTTRFTHSLVPLNVCRCRWLFYPYKPITEREIEMESVCVYVAQAYH